MSDLSQNKGAVLIVDDMENWRDTLRLVLEEDGYYVECARDISEATQAVERCLFDVLVLDIRLNDKQPRDEGIQILKHLRKLGDQTEAIIYTAYPDVETVHQALKELGARDYLIKAPVGGFDHGFLRRFRETVSEAVANSNLRRQHIPQANARRILIIEDDDKWIKLMTEVLLAEHYDVDVAKDLAMAQKMITEQLKQRLISYRLAIVDLQLGQGTSPDSQLPALLSMITRDSPDTDIIIVTAFPSVRRIREAFREYKVHDFHSKDDFNLREFLGSVRESFVEARERFVVAWLEPYMLDGSLVVGGEYTLRITCQKFRSPGYDCVRLRLPSSSKPYRLRVVVHAQDMDVQPSIVQFLDVDPLETRAQPLRFLLAPKEPGSKQVIIDVYYENRLWGVLQMKSIGVI
jgi:DNA-binding NtrC family response regulator